LSTVSYHEQTDTFVRCFKPGETTGYTYSSQVSPLEAFFLGPDEATNTSEINLCQSGESKNIDADALVLQIF
jgi:hypothetical protein